MKVSYRLKDYIHFGRMMRRNHKRQTKWTKHYEAALTSKRFTMPYPPLLQLIPTEACNLDCPMCNQWGENGYFPKGLRKTGHMDFPALSRLIDDMNPSETMISIHGGEPFVYKHIGALLQKVGQREFDVIISTNGTLFSKCLEPLTQLKNLVLLFSIDGDRESHDKIRGAGNFDRSREQLHLLFEARRKAGLPMPMTALSATVCEWTGDVLDKVFDVAREFGVFAVNYNMRWFMAEESGIEYEKQLDTVFGLKSTGAWRSWIKDPKEYGYTAGAEAMARIVKKRGFRLFPPYIVTMPYGLKGKDFASYFGNYEEVFGCDSCFLPFYIARVHSNGDLIYCPGHPDIIAGNVFEQPFLEAFNSELSIKFRKHILENLFPICNRCCGLYMTRHARPYEQKIRRKQGL